MANKKRLYIAYPAYDGRMMASTFISAMNFLMQGSPIIEAVPFVDILYGESHVNRVRNTLAKRFLDTDCTHLLFIDSDIGNNPEQIRALLDRDLPVVCGLYAKKEVGPAQWVINAIEGKEKPDETGLIEIKKAGTGFVLIAREVFQKMIDRNKARQKRNKTMLVKLKWKITGKDLAYITKLCMHDNLEYTDDSAKKLGTCWNFFHSGVWDSTWLSEDWWFSEVWREMGGKIFADTNVQLVHVGHADYPIKQ